MKKQKHTNETARDHKEAVPPDDLIRAHVALYRLYQRAIQLALEADQQQEGKETEAPLGSVGASVSEEEGNGEHTTSTIGL